MPHEAKQLAKKIALLIKQTTRNFLQRKKFSSGNFRSNYKSLCANILDKIWHWQYLRYIEEFYEEINY